MCCPISGICKWIESCFFSQPEFTSLYGDKKIVQQKILDTLKEDAVCAICQETFSKQNSNLYAPACFHLFHEHCIEPWMNEHKHSTCPVCRKECEYEKTKSLWKQFYQSIQANLDLPAGKEEEQPLPANDGQVAGAVLRQELDQGDQLTQDYLLALQLQAQEER